MAPRVAAAQIAHETNVFSAVKTDIAAFRASGSAPRRRSRRRRARHQHRVRRLCRRRGGSGIRPGAADGGLGDPLRHGHELDAIQHLAGLLGDGLRQAQADGPLDGVLLALHGAMVTEIDDDGEGFLLQTARDIVGPNVPIVATLDLHANISSRMVDLADVLIGYDTYPHIDMAERGEEAAAVLARLMRGEIRPTSALRKPPMLPTSQRMTTGRMPMRALIERAHVMEEDPRVINVTVAGGFPPADVADAGFGILVTTDDDPDLAAEFANELATEAWALRDGFLGGVASFEHAAALIRSLDSETTSRCRSAAR